MENNGNTTPQVHGQTPVVDLSTHARDASTCLFLEREACLRLNTSVDRCVRLCLRMPTVRGTVTRRCRHSSCPRPPGDELAEGQLRASGYLAGLYPGRRWCGPSVGWHYSYSMSASQFWVPFLAVPARPTHHPIRFTILVLSLDITDSFMR